MPKFTLGDFYNLTDELFDNGAVRFKDQVSTLKAGIVFADKITTVSPTHHFELLSPEGGMGLDSVLRYREWDFSGILNGIDYLPMYDNLKALMAIKGITIEAIARLLNVHRNTVSGKLDGESEFTFGQAELIQETMFPEYNSKYLFHRRLAS